MPAEFEQISAYPAANRLIRALYERVRAILGPQFVGMYLYGSLAVGAFDEGSDIDVLIVTENALDEATFGALQAMHAELATFESPWADQIEIVYMPRASVRRHMPGDILHPHLDRGKDERLTLTMHDEDWIVQRHALRERGIVIDGPPPDTLIDPITPDDLRGAMRAIMRGWFGGFIDAPERVHTRGYQSYLVLTMCRILYTLEFGTLVSKPVAARWAKETLDPRWSELIDRAWIGRQNPEGSIDPDDLRETLELIRYTLERSRD